MGPGNDRERQVLGGATMRHPPTQGVAHPLALAKIDTELAAR